MHCKCCQHENVQENYFYRNRNYCTFCAKAVLNDLVKPLRRTSPSLLQLLCYRPPFLPSNPVPLTAR